VNRSAMYARGANENPDQSEKPWVYFSRPYATAEAAFLHEYGQRLVDTACAFASNHPVYLVRPVPEMDVNVPRFMALAMMRGEGPDVSISLEQYHQREDFIWAAQDTARNRCGVHILDPIPYLCSAATCKGDRGGRPMYYDSNHLSEFGNRRLVPMFAQIFTGLPAQARAKAP
jgi:hypothetical protein